jgi:threonine/homoserine/homoserine lactone efflux protein
MDPLWTNLVSFLSIFTLAIISPGPNFILVVNRSLSRSRAHGVWTSLGVALGSAFYGLCGLLGWIVLLDSYEYLGTVVRFAGGLYLVVLGGQMGVKFFRKQAAASTLPASGEESGRRPMLLLLSGLAINLSNPKARAFYLSLFTVVLAPGSPLLAKVFLNIAIFLISFSWYALVSILISNPRIQPLFASLQMSVQGLLGGLLVFLGLRLLMA